MRVKTAGGVRVHAGQAAIRDGVQVGTGEVHGRVPDARDAANPRPHPNAPGLQELQRQRPGKAKRRGEPPGELAAAPDVVVAGGLRPGGEVRVAGPGHVPEGVVVLAAGVGVFDQGAQRRAAGLPALVEP